jgi:TolB-like protein
VDLKDFFAELKQRNVYKVAVAYAFVGWLAIQITATVFPILEIPQWAARVVVMLIAIGFPVALILAWAFELTPEGIKRSDEVAPSKSKGRAWIYVGVIAGLLAGGLFFLGRYTARLDRGMPAAVAAKSIAVLPFTNLSEEKANAYFADGIQDEILTRLSKVADLKVISRTSTEKYKSKPANLREIAQELAVANVLEGSVQKAGDQVHINVQLIRAVTDEHLWAESYDRQLKDIFAMEREVAETIAGQLKATLLPQEANELARVPTTNPQAYDLYLKAKYINTQFWNGGVDSNKPAIDLCRQAIQLDPQFALAYAELGHAELRMYSAGEDRSPELLADADSNARKALALQPDLPEGHLLLAGTYSEKHDEKKALAEFQYLGKVWPNEPRVIVALAKAKGYKGDGEGELSGMLRAITLDPRNALYRRWLGDAYVALQRYSEADEAYAKALALEPNDWLAHANRALALISQGKLTEARAALNAWPDAKMTETGRWIRYSTLQRVETLSRNYPAALAAAAKIPAPANRLPTVDMPGGDIQKHVDIGFDKLYQGDAAGAHEEFVFARDELESQRATHADDPDFHNVAALVAAGLGEQDKAIEAARKAVSLVPVEKDAEAGGTYLLTLARVHAHFGNANDAVPLLQQLIDMPTAGLAPAILRLDPIWDPIRGDARVRKLIASEQNGKSEPLSTRQK